MNQVNMEKVWYEKSAARKKFMMEITTHKKSAIRKKRNMKRMQCKEISREK